MSRASRNPSSLSTRRLDLTWRSRYNNAATLAPLCDQLKAALGPRRYFLRAALRERRYLSVLAHAYRLMLRNDEAVDVYKQAIALAPNQIAAHLGLTICYAQAGQLELARIQGREILRVSPKFDMGVYAHSLTDQDPEDSGQPRSAR